MAIDPNQAADEGKIVIPVVHEEVHIGSRTVDTGRGVRIHKTVTEQVQQIDEILARDAVEVRRVVVDKIVPLSEAPVARQVGDTLIVPILEEVVVVEKRLRIKEEVHITKTVHEEHYTDQIPVRTEDVSVERFDEGISTNVHSTQGGNDATYTRSRI